MSEAGPSSVGVVGGGAWGTALAIHCARAGHDTLLYAREPQTIEGINGPTRENSVYLPGFKCPNGLRATSNFDHVLAHTDVILLVVPTPFIAASLEPHVDKLTPRHLLVSCSKGILNDSLETVNEILERVVPPHLHSRLAYLSGPSFAAEVAVGQPTAVTVAAKDLEVAKLVQQRLSTPRFRCYTTTDVPGVELGGALKNVLAIACGIADGLGFGNNGRAALITRGLNEISRLAVAKGAHPLTLAGLAGMGDLVLTCTGDLSRNRQVGLRIGRGEKLPDIMSNMRAVAEGVLTSKSAAELACKLGVDCPIIDGIYRVIHQGADPMEVVTEVMTRALRGEVDDALMQRAREAPSSAELAAVV